MKATHVVTYTGTPRLAYVDVLPTRPLAEETAKAMRGPGINIRIHERDIKVDRLRVTVFCVVARAVK